MINERLKEIRKYFNLNQIKFAERIKISSGYLASLELGNRTINERIIKLICNEFNINKKWFVEGTGEMLNNESENKEFEKLINELKPEYREYVFKQIEELIKLQEN